MKKSCLQNYDNYDVSIRRNEFLKMLKLATIMIVFWYLETENNGTFLVTAAFGMRT